MNTKAARQLPTALVLIAAGAVTTAAPAFARDDDDGRRLSTELSGYNEVHFVAGDAAATPPVPPALRGAVSTRATGKFRAQVNRDEQIIHYELEYRNLEGDVTQAHIHFGQSSTVGGIVVWLCQTGTNPAPAAVAAVTPVCPAEGSVSGTIQPFQVLAQTAQGFAAGEFNELVRALRAGATYANVHSTLFTPGEIRGQIDNHRH
jgi:CHRD domain